MAKTEKGNASGILNFSIDSSLLFQLGEQLVAKPSIALSELVKNAYDADATHVVVRLEKTGIPGGTISIIDNGHGMSLEEVQNLWMRIATTAKREKEISKIYCRPLTGAKGIGRFAARRLGGKLTLLSIADLNDGTKEKVTAIFDWKKNFTPGQDLVSVPITYERKVLQNDIPTGVTLIIEDTRDSWEEEEIVELRRDLLSLQSPFPDLIIRSDRSNKKGCKEDPGFNFELQISGSKELERLSGGLGDAFLRAAWAKLDGKIDADGHAHFDIEIFSTGDTDTLIDDTNKYTGLEGARLRVYYFIYASEYFKESEFNVRDVSQKGREEGGIRIYLDGFRVFPYGSQSDDWLRLDEYAVRNVDMATAISPPERVLELANTISGRPYLLIPRNRQLFGVVATSQTKHSNIEINISRERLLETPTVASLRQFVQNGIYWMTLKYAAFLANEKEKRRKEKAPKSVQEIITEAKSTLASTQGIPEEQRSILALALDDALQRASEEEEDRISEISMLRILASAGTTLSLMNHQLQALISAVSQTEQDLLRLQPSIPGASRSTYDDIINQVSEWHQMVNLQVSQLGFLLTPDSRQRRKRHALYEIIENVKKPMSYYISKNGVSFSNNVPRNLRTPPIYQAELYSVLINIYSNALKAIYGQPRREILVDAEKVDDTLYIRMKDTGVGLPLERREISFKPFITTSLPNPILGTGTGLGLKVVRDILELYGGTARFIDAEKPWKTCIEIVLPDRGASDDN